MAVIRVSCPSCDGLFEVDDEYRGEEVACPKCEVLFRIPDTGTEGVAVTEGGDAQEDTRGEGVFELTCPSCSAVFELPGEYRGEMAECTECETLFLIPDEGNVGVLVEDDGTVSEDGTSADKKEPAAASSKSGGIGTAEKPEPEVTTSGIQRGRGRTSDKSFKKSATVRISRDAVIQNTMKPQTMGAGPTTSATPESPPAQPIVPGGRPASSPSTAQPTPPSTAQPTPPSTAQPPAEEVAKKPGKDGRRGAVSYPPSAMPGGKVPSGPAQVAPPRSPVRVAPGAHDASYFRDVRRGTAYA